jgi:cation:H+ antiporter
MPVADIGLLLLALVVILAGAEAFTNALEHLGEKLRISEGVTGSIFAAVGTALPETMVPVVAILGSVGSQETREEVGVGAILGAPLMLSTLTMFLMAYFAAVRRGWKGTLKPEPTGLRRDLVWFLAAFSLGTAAMFVPFEERIYRGIITLALVVIYFFYLLLTIQASASLVADGHGTEADKPLYLSRVGISNRFVFIVLQLVIGFGLIVLGARGFVYSVEQLSVVLGISTLALSLLIIPVATELPEKVNSILWIRRGRDTLAFGNITGAMVFQGSVLPALGILLTPWEPRPEVLLGAGLTLAASMWLLAVSRSTTLKPYHILANGLCYAAYFSILVT